MNKLKKIFIYFVILSIMAMPGPVCSMSMAMSIADLPVAGTMVNLSPAFEPVLIKGLKVHSENPFLFDFILDTGNSGLKVNRHEFKVESEKLIKYFLASLTIKEDDLWVNLSPYEKNRMIPTELGKTGLGRDMLAQDYILKQLTASLIYPEKHLGQEFWNRVYAKAQAKYGTSEILVSTFNKVWIVAEKAKVLEHNNAVYVVGAKLKVMLDEDYLSLKKYQGNFYHRRDAIYGVSTNQIGSHIIREIIIPELEKEVNQGRNFAPLRQMFYSMILASWYKLALKDALLNQVYSNKAKIGGVLSDDIGVKEKIYEEYLKAYKKGVFNYIKEEMDEGSKQFISRKYFSGGLAMKTSGILEAEQKPTPGDQITVNGAMAVVETFVSKSNAAMILPPVMEFLVTKRCNRDCSICWKDNFAADQEGTLEEHKRMVDMMQANGVVSLTITGGEPLMVSHIVDLVKYAKEKGLRILFYTNSVLLNERKFLDLIPNIDFLSVSINGYNIENDQVSGRQGTFEAGLRTIGLIKQHFPHLKTQILTVASAKNLADLPKIGQLMEQQRQGLQNFRWKISRYKRIGKTAKLYAEEKDPYFIDYETYFEACQAIRRQFDNDFTIAYDTPSYDQSYLYLDSKGVLEASVYGNNISFGNILDHDALERLQGSPQLAKIRNNITSKLLHLGRTELLSQKQEVSASMTSAGLAEKIRSSSGWVRLKNIGGCFPTFVHVKEDSTKTLTNRQRHVLRGLASAQLYTQKMKLQMDQDKLVTVALAHELGRLPFVHFVEGRDR
ncbi:MAG: radical SAM protein [Candidatus Omnitrophica bacterium]|nr:radical SAM protein [Candidatus Omnitrophota bacterium]